MNDFVLGLFYTLVYVCLAHVLDKRLGIQTSNLFALLATHTVSTIMRKNEIKDDYTFAQVLFLELTVALIVHILFLYTTKMRGLGSKSIDVLRMFWGSVIWLTFSIPIRAFWLKRKI